MCSIFTAAAIAVLSLLQPDDTSLVDPFDASLTPAAALYAGPTMAPPAVVQRTRFRIFGRRAVAVSRVWSSR